MPSLLRDLADQIGADNVLDRPADLAAYAEAPDAPPAAVVFPTSTAEVAALLRVCAVHGAAVVPRGAGAGNAQAPTGAVVLSLARMTRVIGAEAEARRAHVEAGVITADVQRLADSMGLLFAPDPPTAASATIGGVVACDAHGARALIHGTARSHVAGLTVVMADGTIVRLGEGGEKDDLFDAVIGSEGALCVITEVIVSLLPRPAATVAAEATFGTLEAVRGALRTLGKATGVLTLDGATTRAFGRTAMSPLDSVNGAVLLAEFAGTRADVDAATEAFASAARTAGADDVRLHDTSERGDGARVMQRAQATVAGLTHGATHRMLAVGGANADTLAQRAHDAALAHEATLFVFGHNDADVLHLCVAGPGGPAPAAAVTAVDEVIAGMKVAGASRPGGRGSKGHGGDHAGDVRRLKATHDARGLLHPRHRLSQRDAETAAAHA